MPIFKNITGKRRCQRRALIVRLIEDAIMLFFAFVGVQLAGRIIGAILRVLGVI